MAIGGDEDGGWSYLLLLVGETGREELLTEVHELDLLCVAERGGGAREDGVQELGRLLLARVDALQPLVELYKR